MLGLSMTSTYLTWAAVIFCTTTAAVNWWIYRKTTLAPQWRRTMFLVGALGFVVAAIMEACIATWG
jgi:hypothetical protein